MVTGDGVVGQTLTSTQGEWSGTTPMAFSFRWLRCPTGDRHDCLPIDGATSPSYTLTDADAGSTVRSRVTATNDAGSASESSVRTAVVTSGGPPLTAPASVSAPVLGDATHVGQTLTSTQGEWSGSTPMTFSYRWFRCPGGARTECRPIDGADDPSYVLRGDDVGFTVRVLVAAANGAGHASAPTGVIVPAV